MDKNIGKKLDGRYEITELIGVGGMADVYKGTDVIDNKPLDCEGKSYSGKYLMEHGLEMPYVHEVDWGKKNDWSSRVLYLEVE